MSVLIMQPLAACHQLVQYTNKKGGIERGGLVSPSGLQHMAAVLAVCRKALVDTG